MNTSNLEIKKILQKTNFLKMYRKILTNIAKSNSFSAPRRSFSSLPSKERFTSIHSTAGFSQHFPSLYSFII